MSKRKLEDLLKHREVAATHSARQTDKSTEHADDRTSTSATAQLPAGQSQKRSRRTKRASGPVDVSKELASLKYPASQNKQLPKLPSSTTISKRPINHGPIASRFAGSNVPKVVYISRKTPVISAVKRVKQFLREIEKRAMQSSGIDGVLNRVTSGRNGDSDLQIKLRQVSEKLEKDKEEVLVKASGRAIEQALRVGEWFRNREDETLCNVDVRTGSVSVVDDIIEVEPEAGVAGAEHDHEQDEDMVAQEDSTLLEVGDTTMELLKNLEDNRHDDVAQDPGQHATDMADKEKRGDLVPSLKRKRRKNKKKEYDQDDIPEARLRWVKTVEVAVSLRA